MTPGIWFILEQMGQALQNAEVRIRYLEEALTAALQTPVEQPEDAADESSTTD